MRIDFFYWFRSAFAASKTKEKTNRHKHFVAFTLMLLLICYNFNGNFIWCFVNDASRTSSFLRTTYSGQCGYPLKTFCLIEKETKSFIHFSQNCMIYAADHPCPYVLMCSRTNVKIVPEEWPTCLRRLLKIH